MTSFDASGLPDVPLETLRGLRLEIGDFVLVGMAAVDLITRALADLPASRLTRDVDVAVAVDTEPALRELTRRLVDRGEDQRCTSGRTGCRSTWCRSVAWHHAIVWCWRTRRSTSPACLTPLGRRSA